MGRRSSKPGAGLIVLLAKAGPKLISVLAKTFKSAKLVKVGMAGASVVSYSAIFTWKFALMIMFLLFIHESGHVWAMKRCGVKTKGIYFVPFVGAAAVAEEMFPSRQAEVYIAIMGPIWGFGLSFLTALVYFATRNPLFAAAASWMALVNLFNLLPINPLDGGRIMKSIAFSISSNLGLVFLGLGIIVCGYFALTMGIVLFFILLIVGALELLFEYARNRDYIRLGQSLDASLVRLEDLKQTVKNNEPHSHLLDELLESYRQDRKNLPILVPLNKIGIFASAVSYLGVVGILWALMNLMSHVPAAKLALEMLAG